MRLSKGTRRLLRIAIGDHAGVHLHPADRDRDLRVQLVEDPRLAAARLHHSVGHRRGQQRQRPGRVHHLDQGRPGRDGDRPDPRHAGLAGRRAPPVLRPRDDLVPRHPADRAPRDRHRRRAQRHVHPGPRHRPEPVHRDRRPRHVLHRRRLQQRDRAPAQAVGLVRGGLGRPRRRPVADVPSHHDPEHAHGAGGRRRCSPSRSPSTRSSSRTSRSAPASRPCRSGSSPTCSGPTSCRSSTWSP